MNAYLHYEDLEFDQILEVPEPDDGDWSALGDDGLDEIVEERRIVCSACNGTNVSPYDWDGGGCPHCFHGFVEG